MCLSMCFPETWTKAHAKKRIRVQVLTGREARRKGAPAARSDGAAAKGGEAKEAAKRKGGDKAWLMLDQKMRAEA